MGSTTIRGNRFPASSAAPDVPGDIQKLAEDLDDAPRYRRGSLAGIGLPASYPRTMYEATDGSNAGRWFFSTGSAWVEVVMVPLGTADIADGAVTPAKHGQAPGLRAELSSAFSVPHNALTPIQFATVTADAPFSTDTAYAEKLAASGGAHFLVSIPGWYIATGDVQFTGHATGTRRAQITMRDVSASADRIVGEDQSKANDAAAFTTLSVSGLYRADVGDYFMLQGYQNSGGSLNVQPTMTHLAIARVGS